MHILNVKKVKFLKEKQNDAKNGKYETNSC